MSLGASGYFTSKLFFSLPFFFFFILIQECVATDISPETAESLFRILEDDSNEEPPCRKSNTVTVTSDDQKQEQAVKCLVKMIHLIHQANLNKRQQVHVSVIFTFNSHQ